MSIAPLATAGLLAPAASSGSGAEKHNAPATRLTDPEARSAPTTTSAATSARDAHAVSPDAAVRLSGAVPDKAPARALQSAVYAEIWRNGVKLAQVDIHGQVTPAQGSLAVGSMTSGPLLAAQRALQVARQLNGEIRTAGQPVDGQTLLMRERLAQTYVTQHA